MNNWIRWRLFAASPLNALYALVRPSPVISSKSLADSWRGGHYIPCSSFAPMDAHSEEKHTADGKASEQKEHRRTPKSPMHNSP